jgi:hypothetical protein
VILRPVILMLPLFEQRSPGNTSVASVDCLVTTPDDWRYQELRPHWQRVRTLSSALLQRTSFESTPTNGGWRNETFRYGDRPWRCLCHAGPN